MKSGESAAREFFELLWPDGIPDNLAVPLVGMRDRRPSAVEFAADVGLAAKWCADRDQYGDVYAQMAAISRRRAEELVRLPGIQRGKADDVAAVPGFYIDFDCGPGKLEDLEAIDRVIAELPLKPTAMVSTGSGANRHAHFLFHEPMAVSTPVEIRTAEAITHGWSLVISYVARRLFGARVDSVWDLARIGRVPGTRNHKREPLGDVVLVYSNGPRHDPSDFDGFAAEPTRATAGDGSALEGLGAFTVRPDADIPMHRFRILAANDQKFQATWDHKRPDLIDQTNSAYDLALAVMAFAAGWSAQEVCDLIVAHRRMHADKTSHTRDPLKLKNPSYYVKTLCKAAMTARKIVEDMERDAADVKAAEGVIEVASATDDELVGEFSTEQAKRKVREYVKRHTGIAVDHIEEIGESSNEVYIVHAANIRPAEFSSYDHLASWARWRKQAQKNGLRAPNAKPPDAWDDAVSAMRRVMVEVPESGATSSLMDLIRNLWATANDTQRATERAGYDGLVKRRTKSLRDWGYFRELEGLAIHVSTFVDRHSDKPSVRQMKDRKSMIKALRYAGAEASVVAITGSTKSVYIVPARLLSGAAESVDDDERYDEEADA